MFDAKLFLELCEEYDVPLNSSNGKCQLQKEDNFCDLTDEEIKNIIQPTNL